MSAYELVPRTVAYAVCGSHGDYRLPFGCSTLLRIVSPTDGFCDECLERSRRCREDDLGGES